MSRYDFLRTVARAACASASLSSAPQGRGGWGGRMGQGMVRAPLPCVGQYVSSEWFGQ
jgi:hypothetical protein